MEHPVASILKELLESAGIPNQGVSQKEAAGQTIFSIGVDGDPRMLIGPHGDTIHAIDHLVKKIHEKRSGAQEGGEHSMFLIDVNDYRTKQIKDLQTKALMMAERAKSFQYDVELSPMSAYERLIVHTTLADVEGVKTESQGEGRGRRVVIKYAGNA